MKKIVRRRKQLEFEKNAFVVEAIAKELKPEWVQETLRECGRESLRERLLPASFIVWFVILLGLFRRISYANLLWKLKDSWWTRQHWPDDPPTTTAVTKARDRLGVEPMKKLYERCAREWTASSSGLVFHNRRVFAFDGSTYKTPDSLENDRGFGRPGASRGRTAYPQMRAVTLTDVGTRIRLAERHGPYRSSEISLARQLLPDIPLGSLVLLDRGFRAYDFLWDLQRGGSDFLLRVPDNIKPRLIQRLGSGDAIVEVDIPRHYRKERPDMPKSWILRMISYLPEGSSATIRLFTTIQDPQVPKEELAMLYHERWEEETATDEFKTHLCGCATVNRAVVFRSQKPERIEQEWYGLLIAHNAVHKTMASAASVVTSSPRRLSFTAALERLREATYEMMRLLTNFLRDRYQRLLKSIARATIPHRRDRKNPRCVKIKMSKYLLKKSKYAA
jgi:hypothetical protein